MTKDAYNPRAVPDILTRANESVPENRTNRYTKKLLREVTSETKKLLAIIDPSLDQMAELSGAMNTGCLLANELTDGQLFKDYPELQRGRKNFSTYYLQQDSAFV